VWKIRYTEIQIGQSFLDPPQFIFYLLDLFADGLHGGHGSIRRLFLSLQLGNLVRPFSQFVAKLLDLAGQGATLFDQRADSIPRDISATGTKLIQDGV
jgi:hypothetical protein